MAKAQLEEILGEITKTPGQPGANSNYSFGTLTKTSDYMGEFSGINTSTIEGLKKYREVTGLPTKGVSAERMKLTADQIRAELKERFADYTGHHIKLEIGELDEMTQSQMGYSFCPIEETGSGEYRTTNATVQTAKKTIDTIKNDPKKYIEDEIAAAPNFMKGIVGRMSDQVCAIDASGAEKKAFRAIAEYGSAKFIGDTYGHQVAARVKIQMGIGETARERKELQENIKPGLDAEEEATYFAENNKEVAALEKRWNETADPNKLRETIVGETIAAIKAKEQAPSQ